MNNIKWLQSGKTGCTFATLFAKNPESVGWKFYSHTTWEIYRLFDLIDANIITITFPDDWNIEKVSIWAYKLGFFY